MAELADLLAELTSGDEARAEAAVPGLVALGEAAFPALRDLLTSPRVDDRWWALRVLAQNEQVETVWLLTALEDPQAEVRQCAALGLCSHPEHGSIAALVRALSDPDSLAANLAAAALISVGEPAVPALLDALNEAAQAARLNAMRALAAIGDGRAIPAMMAALEEDSALMQHWAEAGLERLGLDMVYFNPD